MGSSLSLFCDSSLRDCAIFIFSMAIVVDHALGWIVDEQRWYNSCYDHIRYHILPSLYEIDEPFRMDSQVEAMNKRREESTPTSTVKTKKRKRLNRSIDRSNSGPGTFQSGDFEILVEAGRSVDYFTPIREGVELTNNRRARDAAKSAESNASFPKLDDLRTDKKSEASMLHLSHGDHCDAKTVANAVFANDFEESIIFQMQNDGDQDYLVPRRCRFVLGDVGKQLNRLKSEGLHGSFDLIILDPPWQNKAVKRQKTYTTFDETALETLPIPEFLQPNGLVAIWVTNNPRYYDFVIDVLLPKWNLTFAGRWFWFKVTKSGEPVYQHSTHCKLPYESLIIARSKRGDPNKYNTKIPDGKLIVSVPSALPSRKPPLLDILKQFYQLESLSCLELYARYLLPDTFSIGNEVLKFQCLTYFESIGGK